VIVPILDSLEAIALQLEEVKSLDDPFWYSRILYAQARVNEAIQFLRPLKEGSGGLLIDESSAQD
jgi:hypothetical protein